MSGEKLNPTDASLGMALALAAHYFPRYESPDDGVRARMKDAHTFLSGHVHAWGRWEKLPADEKGLIGRMLAQRPEKLADVKYFARAVRGYLHQQAEQGGDFLHDGKSFSGIKHAIPRVGGDLLGYVGRQVERLEKERRPAKPSAFAGPGRWVEIAQRPEDFDVPKLPGFEQAFERDEVLPRAVSATRTGPAPLDFEAMLTIASLLDEAQPPEKRYLHKVLQGFLDKLQAEDDDVKLSALKVPPGVMSVLNAPTGTGKSVLGRIAASYCATHDLTLTMVLPDVNSVMAAAYEIECDLEVLRKADYPGAQDATSTMLISPNGLAERAEKAASRLEENAFDPGQAWTGFDGWKIDQLTYGCSMRTFSEDGSGADVEPCVVKAPGKGGPRACAWMPACGKFQQQRDACTANVVVTNHHNFLMGMMRIGVDLDGHQRGRLPVRTLLMARSHLVIVDEADQFQSTAIEVSSGSTVLASRHEPRTPLAVLDEDSKTLSLSKNQELTPAILHARYLAEQLLNCVAHGDLVFPGLDQDRITSKTLMARSYDRTIIKTLFPAAGITDQDDVPLELYEKLNAIDPSSKDADLLVGDADLLAIREQLRELLSDHQGEDRILEVKESIGVLLQDRVQDHEAMLQVRNLLIVRTWLEALDGALESLRRQTASVRGSGLASARDLANVLSSSLSSGPLPYGPISRSLTGYQLSGMDDPGRNAQLVVHATLGDPHSYVAQLGSVVALALTGSQVPILGLSATAYFPGAARTHLHAPVRWWMTDAASKSIAVQAGQVAKTGGEFIQVSGLGKNHKNVALRELGAGLYDQYLDSELRRLAAEDHERRHLLIVVNSYAQCASVAQGINDADSFDGTGLCVAVREQGRRHPLPPGAVALTPDEFVDFPHKGSILVAPLARVARGLNIMQGLKSAISSVWVCVRPLSLLTEPQEIFASFNAVGARLLVPAELPTECLEIARTESWHRLHLLLRSSPYFTHMEKDLQEEVISHMIVTMIQLAGRARRGGTEMSLYLVDHAFHKEKWEADAASIIKRMYEGWPDETRKRMDSLYQEALRTFLAYSGVDPATGPTIAV